MKFLNTNAILCVLLITFNAAYAQFEYVFPVDGSRNEFPFTHMIIRNGQMMDANSLTPGLVTLTGSKSGIVPATIVLSTDGKTVCITPSTAFAYGETVTMSIKDGLRTQAGQILSGTSSTFTIRHEMSAAQKQNLEEYLSTHDQDGALLNDPERKATYIPPPSSNTLRTNPFDFINIYTNTTPAPGQIFFHRNNTYPVLPKGYGIMENNGDSVFFRSSSSDGANFHMNLNGHLTAYRLDLNVDTSVIEMDSLYNIIANIHCGNGFTATQHEQIFLPSGYKWFTIYDYVPADLSQYGGSSSAILVVSWIQELDPSGQVIFQWQSDTHFAVTDATGDFPISASVFDPWHINSMFIDDDGNLIASFRNMDMTIKMNSSTGAILWYWGYNPNPNYSPLITFQDDPNGGWSHPHHIHRIAPGLNGAGNILLMDNGNLHFPPVSQPKEYVLDEINYIATTVWYYTHPQVNNQNVYTKQQGSVQRLPNGNTIIGYGLPTISGLPNGTEIDAAKNIVWEFRFKDSTEYSYRIYKEVWYPNVGIANFIQGKDLEVFPNPGNGMFTINAEGFSGAWSISVVNLLGQMVFSQTNTGSLQNHTLDLTGLDKGIYLLQIKGSDGKICRTIVIQ